MLSKELQIGKAGEHLVCCDLIMQGFNAFLADQGVPFDIIVEKDGIVKRIQVRSTTKLRNGSRATNIYRFGTRFGMSHGKQRRRDPNADYCAFVALDIMKIAYLPISEMTSKDGKIKTTIDFKSRAIEYRGRKYSNGNVRYKTWGRFFEDLNKFKF